MKRSTAPWHAPTGFQVGQGMNERSRPSPAAAGSTGPEDSRQGAGVRRVLIVDDEHLIADTLSRILNLNGFIARAAYSGESALSIIPELCPEIVLTDVRMPGQSGLEVGRLIRKQCPHTRVVLFSGEAGVTDMAEGARRNGMEFELWQKPIHPRELVNRLRSL